MKKLATLILVSLLASSCSPPEERELNSGMKLSSSGDSRAALDVFDRVLKRAPDSSSATAAAREGARLSLFVLKDYKRAARYLRALVLRASDATERQSAEKQLAAVYFENLQNYAQAVIEFNRLLAMNPPFLERVHDQMMMARANFYLGEFQQAESEVDDLLKERLQPQPKFEALMLKGNVQVAGKKFSEAAGIFRALIKEFPDRSRQENIGLQLAVCEEERQDYRSAIAVLEDLKDSYQPKEYIELRIKRLQERAKNQPGAKGYHK